MQRAVAIAVERFGGLDVVVANAGIASRVATFRAIATGDVRARARRQPDGRLPHRRRRAARDHRRRGHIVVISSIYAFMNGVGEVPYAMSKAAVEQLGRALRVGARPARRERERRVLRLHRHRDGPPGDGPGSARRGDDRRRCPSRCASACRPSVAGEAIVRGIERRQPRIIQPRRWTAISVLRGILGPLSDARLERRRSGAGARLRGSTRARARISRPRSRSPGRVALRRRACGASVKRFTNASAVSATSRQPLSIVSACPRPAISTISVTPGLRACACRRRWRSPTAPCGPSAPR